MSEIEELKRGLFNGLIDSKESTLENYKPKLLVNDETKGEKVITSLITELSKCDEFLFSVAFVTYSGVNILLETLKELEKKGIKGKILASQYQSFTEPKALRKLLKFSNIELKIITEETARMHTKGYLFKNDNEYSIIVGSSNLTQNALCENKEWNVKINSFSNGSLIKSIVNEYYSMFEQATSVDETWLSEYEKIYKAKAVWSAKAKKLQLDDNNLIIEIIRPNAMQTQALGKLEELRKAYNAKRALIISSTGTGKTYLAAFDVKICNPKKFLFVVHRETIANAAMDSFKKVIGPDKTYGILGGGNTTNANYVFSMVNTLAKDDVLNSFKKDEFDYIVIDEVHRAAASSYQKIINYFTPKFMLGMTATPERMDGLDIYKIFDHNIAYEIRLADAMSAHLICPFHYFGIAELSINGKVIDDETTDIRVLTADERVRNIIEKAEFYGYSGNRVRGLVFCSSVQESTELSNKFNLLGYNTVSLSGNDGEEAREQAISKLEQESREGGLDYIFTRDIFNEGVDIPNVNQVIMLRPTESSIIFIQQLGRGLRKRENKEFVVVLDFIGNYENNFMIPIALSGDNSHNKDNMRRYVKEGNKIIPGCSTITFDQITRERIYNAIDNVRFNDTKLIKTAYEKLKQRIGRVPELSDFSANNSIDIMRIIDKFGSYYEFLELHYKADNVYKFSELERKYIKFVSSSYLCGKRPHELEFIKLILNKNLNLETAFRQLMKTKYSKIKVTNNTITCITNQLMQQFNQGTARGTFSDAVFLDNLNGYYHVSNKFAELMKNESFVSYLSGIVELGLSRNAEIYSNRYQDTAFELYRKYTYADVCRGLDWDKGEVAFNIGGYKYHRNTNTLPIFINYNKDDDISATIAYEDKFLSPNEILEISKSNRTIDSDDIQNMINAKKHNTDICLFVRKNKNDSISKEFYYLGRISYNGKLEQFTMPNTDASAVKIGYNLDVPVRSDIYDYIVT